MLLFGLFSLATALAWSFPTLLLARLLTGVGLGGIAEPDCLNLGSRWLTFPRPGGKPDVLRRTHWRRAGGGAGLSGLAAAAIIFWIGGVVPLLLIPLLMRWLPESQAFQRAEASVPLRTLFAQAGRRYAAVVAGLFSPCWWSIC